MAQTRITRKRSKPKVNVRPIFLSYSHRDHRLADEFLKLLNTGLGIDIKSQVFKSANTWTGTRFSGNKYSTLQSRLRDADVRIALITPNYLKSETCNAELGFMWGEDPNESKSHFFPFQLKLPENNQQPWYMRPIDPGDLVGADDIDAFAQELTEILDTAKFNNDWESIRSNFIDVAAGLVPDVPVNIDYTSMRKFIEASEQHDRIVFFNIQISFEDWFRPELQTHLALQDATNTYYQWQKVVNANGEGPAIRARNHLPPYFATPSARVMFVSESRIKLETMLKEPGNPRARSFVDLVLIHLFMGCPLAIVTVDQLDDIMRQTPSDTGELNFYDMGVGYEHVLGLPRLSRTRNPVADEKNVQKSLEHMIGQTKQHSAGIDFAVLMKNGKPTQSQVWRACVNGGNLEYYPVNAEDKDSSRDIFCRFGKKLEHAVFVSWKHKEDLIRSELHENIRIGDPAELSRFHLLIGARHPFFRVFHESGVVPALRPKFWNVMKFVKPEFCPLSIIEKAQVWDHVFRLSHNMI